MYTKFEGNEHQNYIHRNQKMKENEYRNLIRKKIIELGFNYLMNKRGSKGKEIEYDKIRMAQYLQPNNQLEVKEKRKIFNSETE